MARVRSKDTSPELVVRRIAHRLGYRFRLHRRDLPGTPDLVFPMYRAVIFVHGCFWHQHACSRGSRIPKTNQDYWKPKLERNVLRDSTARSRLTEQKWRVLVIWECETRDRARVAYSLSQFLTVLDPPDGGHL
ncbi:MAG TPA: DNA mismatch endonuclease Vsr [Allosphingosinicella sp.]